MAEFKHNFPPLSENLAKKLRALKLKKNRDREGLFLAEGLRLCEEALAAGAVIREMILTEAALKQARVAQLAEGAAGLSLPVHVASERQFHSLSDELSPQGIVVVATRPAARSYKQISGELVLACDGIQDPGNLGTILRTAEWFGCNDILLNEGCVELTNPKVVRATMGAIFRLRFYEKLDFGKTLPALKQKGYRIIGTKTDAALDLREATASGKDVLIFGNEAHGLSPETTELLDAAVYIPQKGRGESLNAAVAAAICLYHFSQK